MTKSRMEAFSDGVIAIIMTIMVLELRAPHLADLSALAALRPVFISYALSFVFVGIYWNNHHHMIQSVKHISGGVLWANHHLLFWLSLIPFGTAWMGEHNFASGPVFAYGVVLLGCAIAYTILGRMLVKANGPDSPVAIALGRDYKGKLSLALYVVGILAALPAPWVSCALYFAVAVIWFIPDRRFENSA